MGLLKTLKPQWWFSAHLHVRFEATVFHGDGSGTKTPIAPVQALNPDEIVIDVDDFEGEAGPEQPTIAAEEKPSASVPQVQPVKEIVSGDGDGEAGDAPAADPPKEATTAGPRLETKFLALDKCLPRREFLEVCSMGVEPIYNLTCLGWQVECLKADGGFFFFCASGD